MENSNFKDALDIAVQLLTCKNLDLPVSAIGEILKWREISIEIPYIQFPKSWKVKIVPPFAGATSRFYITKEGLVDSYVSVYLDYYDMLGFVGQPYWEVYDGEETERYLMNEISELLKGISKALKRIKRKNKC